MTLLKKPLHAINRFFDKQYSTPMFSHKKFFRLLGPSVLDQVSIYLIEMLATAMISASSQDSVSAVSLVGPILFLSMSLYCATANGGTVVVAQYKGKGDQEKVNLAAGQTVTSTVGVAFIIMILQIALANPMVYGLFGSAGNVICDKAILYLVGHSVTYVMFGIFQAAFSVLRGLGDSKGCLYLTVIINSVFLVLSVLFLNVMHLDILGTILAYFLARVVGVAAALWFLLKKRDDLRVRWRDIFRFDKTIQKSIFKMGIPFAAEQMFYNGGTIIAQAYMVKLGTAAIAANAIANSLFMLATAPGFAVAAIALTVIGQCVGADRIDLAKHYGPRLDWLGNAMVTASALIIIPMLPIMLQMYAPEPETAPLILPLMVIGTLFLPLFWGGANILPQTIFAAGDAVFMSVASLVCMWVMRVGVGYILALPLGLGINGVWIAMGLEWILKAAVFQIRFRDTKWYSKKVVS